MIRLACRSRPQALWLTNRDPEKFTMLRYGSVALSQFRQAQGEERPTEGSKVTVRPKQTCENWLD
jgi:hypothetical protein